MKIISDTVKKKKVEKIRTRGKVKVLQEKGVEKVFQGVK